MVFNVCRITPLVRNCDKLYAASVKVLGTRFVHALMRPTFFDHFCGGETTEDIKPCVDRMMKQGVGSILDYAAEADEEAVTEHASAGEAAKSERYQLKDEALCDARMKIFLDAVEAVKEATPTGFAAVKITALVNPLLLERISLCVVKLAQLFERIRLGKEAQIENLSYMDHHRIDRSGDIEIDVFVKHWQQYFKVENEEELRSMINDMDADNSGFISFLEWSSSIGLTEINALVRTCLDKGPMYHAALDDDEIKLYLAAVYRVETILDLAAKLNIRVMIDAEALSYQPAIDLMVLDFQRKYNRDTIPIVYQTYQTYLKGMDQKVMRDLERSRTEGWHCAAKIVRGAYMVSERKIAELQGLESPIHDTYKETEANFHKVIESMLTHNVGAPPNSPPGSGEAEILVASHNRDSVAFTVQLIQKLERNRDNVHFGQLLGMGDHLTSTLGAHGYKAYKYVPYGPMGDVVPYLIRRTQENSTFLGSQGVQEERGLLTKELARRIIPFKS